MSRDKLLAYVGPLVIAACTVLAVDVAAYFFLPPSAVAFAPTYRKEPSSGSAQRPAYTRAYPKGYFRADPVLGFDIEPNSPRQLHHFADASVEIFSNELGCFDSHSLKEIQGAPGYDYFAGDSMTWGYAEYQEKFATVYERVTGRLSCKCGVSHTGQVHQYTKFKKLVTEIGRYPKRVFVGYTPNDVANDLVHPHTTVVEGFQVDTVELRDGQLVQRDLGHVRQVVEDALAQDGSAETGSNKGSAAGRLKAVIKRFSLTYHLLASAKNKFIGMFAAPGTSFYLIGNRYDFGRDYTHNPLTQRNRDIIDAWHADSKKNSYELIFILIPPGKMHDDRNFYAGLKAFLARSGIRFLDLTTEFANQEITAVDAYWPLDGHLSGNGNVFLGQLLAKHFP